MMKCPVCEKYDFEMEDDFDVCDVCGWENDGLQYDEPDYDGGANWVSLNKARANYKECGKAMSETDRAEYKAYCELEYGKRTVEAE